jgi:hypothetical protein
MNFNPIHLYFEKPDNWQLGSRTGWIHWRACLDAEQAVKVARDVVKRDVLKGTTRYKLVDKRSGEEIVRSVDTLKDIAV